MVICPLYQERLLVLIDVHTISGVSSRRLHNFASVQEPQITTRIRRILREILFSILLTAVVIMIWDGEVRWWWIILFYSMPLGFVVWLVFRILRFALGPSLHARLARH